MSCGICAMGNHLAMSSQSAKGSLSPIKTPPWKKGAFEANEDKKNEKELKETDIMNFFRHEEAIRLRSSNLKEAAILARDSSGQNDSASGRCHRCLCIWGRVGSDIDCVCMCIRASSFP